MKSTHQLLVGTFLLLNLNPLFLGQNAEAADPFNRFYNEACVPEAKKAGFTEAEAKQGCSCTIKALRNKYPTPAFTALLAQYLGGQSQARQTLTRYGQNCFEDIVDGMIFEN